jgi:hypothetical protein
MRQAVLASAIFGRILGRRLQWRINVSEELFCVLVEGLKLILAFETHVSLLVGHVY